MSARKIVTDIIRFFLWSFLIVFLLLTAAVIAGGVWALTVPDASLKEELFLIGVTDRTTRLYCVSADGTETELTADRISGYENALYCPIGEIPENLKNAFVAIEDKRFYEHGGIDYIRTGRACAEYLKSGGNAPFGGSTITQQLVKNLTGDSEKNIRRKAGEILRAAKVERRLSKEAILEQYLNIVNLSENCYGVRTAANAYFSKEPAELTLSECATLAAITNNPARYDPIRHPEANRERRNLILSQMLEQNMIGKDEYRQAVDGDVTLSVNSQVMSGRVNSWYADLAVSDVIRDLMKEKGMNRAEASRMVYCGGLRIYTVMDPALQRAVTEYYRDPDNFPTHEGGKKAQSAIVIADPSNGNILAIAGAVGEKTSNRIQNYAIDTKRPSGSVIKPLSVYGPALEKNLITYGSVFDDVPAVFRTNGAPWPRNSPNFYRGLTTINSALTQSVNTVSVSVLERLGSRESFRFLADELEMESLRPDADMNAIALALGQQSEGVTLRELIGGYTAIANGGVYENTRSYSRVLNSRGEEILTSKPAEKRVLSEDTVGILTMMLRHVVREGTGKALTLKNFVDAAGKTGTSSRNCDKWFIGYTPELLAGVWYGYEYPASLSDVKGNPALTVFDQLMTEAIRIRPVSKPSFETPDGIVAVRYCKDSGKLLSSACYNDPRGDRSEIGYFKKGTQPTEVCDCHVTVSYCRGGGVATPDCPAETCRQVALIRADRHFPRQIYVADAAYTCPDNFEMIQPELSYNTPYFAKKGDFVGIGMEEVPYNHACPVHTADPFFKRRFLIS